MNWVLDERPRFKCPECNGLAERMATYCSNCGARVTYIPEGNYTKYRARFAMNGGCRREEYIILLTPEEYEKIKSITNDDDLYGFITWEMWDRVIDVYISPGTDYEGFCGDIEEGE
jgi:hypothetical protein